MIVTGLSGGLGNQLFMYATARAMSLRLGVDLVLNVHKGFSNDIKFNRNFELDSFNLNYKINNFLSFDYPVGNFVIKASRHLGRNLLYPSYIFLRDQSENRDVDKRILSNCKRNVYLEGYWQSEQYFVDYEKEIRNDLQFNATVTKKISGKVCNIFCGDRTVPVCVGVRRYQECRGHLPFDILDEYYYMQAMKYMTSQISGNIIFYVLTQDKEWVSDKIIKNSNLNIVLLDEGSPIEDLALMSTFKYHIISNSSFYWWGAWLANSNIVVSTDKFINKKSNLNSWKVIRND